MAKENKSESEVREGERIAKVMARAGLCSRREAEDWIAAGRVSVNGEVLTSPAFNVGFNDAVEVDGKPLGERQRTRLFAYHKPRGLITSSRDPEGRSTVFEALPPNLPRVVSIGRLDINTEGLLLLTNDGGLARVLELPETGWLRRYRVRAHGEINQAQLDALRDGISVEGVNYAGIEARLERTVGSNTWLIMGLREGKNREIKRVLEHLGLQVNRLIRISFGPFELADLPEGEVAEVPTRVLRDQLGVKLAKRAAADFDAPLHDAPRPEPEPEPEHERPRRGKSERGARGPDPAREPRREGGTTEPRKRKHVSILRAEARAEAETERRRVVRSATSDRKGREVKVEHVSLARPARAPKSEDRKGGGRGEKAFGERPARDFAPRSRSRDEAPARGDGPKPRTRSDRPARDSAPRSKSYGDAPAREFAPRSRPRGDAPGRSDAGSGRSRDDRPTRDSAPRSRSYGDAPAREFAPRSRPPRGEAPAGRDAGAGRSRDDRPARDSAPRSKPYGDAPKSRPRGEAPAGRDAAPERSREDRPARSKPYGDGAPKFRKPREEGAPRSRPHGDGPSRSSGPRSKPFGDKPPREGAQRSRPPRDGASRDGAPRGGGFKSGPPKGRPSGPRSGGKPPRRPG